MNTEVPVYWGFLLLSVLVAGLIAWASKSRALTLCIALWMVLAGTLAAAGVLRQFHAAPPPIVIFLIAGFVGTVALSRSSWARRLIALPLGTLIGFHAFRIAVEILIHQSSLLGLAPPQMSWSGYNFDVITGVTALLLAPFARSAPRSVVLAWNWMGLTLLGIVVTIAAVSFPTRFQLMRPDNAWVASFPYVWLPAILVTGALLGHLVIFRALSSASSRSGDH